MRLLPRSHRPGLADERGFTLVELLVVIMIIGLLAAIALPSLLAQRTRAQDAEAKVYAVAAQKAFEVFHTEHDTYAGADPAALARIESSLARARGLSVDGTATGFEVGVDSAADIDGGGRFTLKREADGDVVRTCTNAGRGSCDASGEW